MVWLLMLWVMFSGFKEFKTEGFKIYFSPELESFAQMIFKKAPKAKAFMEKQLGKKFFQPIEIIISPAKDFIKLQPGSPPEWATATAYPEKNLIFLKPLPRTNPENLQHTFLHELAHLFIYQRLNQHQAPRWFEEGLAEIFSAEFSFERFSVLARIGLSRAHIPFSELDQRFPFHSREAQFAYLQSQDFVSFLIVQLGQENFSKLLDQIAEGEDFYTSLTELAGKSFSELEKEWAERLKYRYGWTLLLGGSGSLWFFISLLFLLAYLTKRRRARQKKELMGYEDYASEIPLEGNEEDDDEENLEGRNLWH